MEREFSIRESIHKALLHGPVTVRDLSRIVGIREHDVAQHLEHLKRSLKHRGQVLVIEPPACLDCGFAFPHRDRYTRPSGCPKCRGRRLGPPRFRVEDVSG
jgi:predicted Zn-ribbon and HTH transcriptional regulator